VRIVVAAWSGTIVGGQETHLRALLPQLQKTGHQVLLFHERPLQNDAEAIVPAHVPVDTLPATDARPPGIPAELERWAPDVVYVHGLESAELEAALLARFPCVLFAHNYYGTCATGTKRFAFPHTRACTRALGPACFALNYARRCGGLSPITFARLYALQARRRKHLPLFGAVLVASEHMRREMLRHGVEPDRLHLVPLPPTDLEADAERPRSRPPAGVILFLGRLVSDKGAHLLIDAMPEAERALDRPLRLVVAGAGPEMERLRAQARARRVRADFPGWLGFEAKTCLFREADLIAVSSVSGEPFGLVGIEAGCVGTPAVAFDAGGIREWLKPGVTGELAPADPPTAAGLAAAIVRVLRDPAHFQALREGAWQACRMFTMDAHLAALEPVLAAAAR
jgi:glycosyltransferase involved in cell wall biosynthesis